MDKDELLQQLMVTFLEELNEHTEAMNKNLLALEKGPSGDERAVLTKLLLRSGHSLKGAAHAVNVTLIERACHELENIFVAVREDKLTLTPERFSLLFKAVDAVEEAGMRLREQHSLGEAPLNQLLGKLQEVTSKPTTIPAAEPPAAPKAATEAAKEPVPQAPVALAPAAAGSTPTKPPRTKSPRKRAAKANVPTDSPRTEFPAEAPAVEKTSAADVPQVAASAAAGQAATPATATIRISAEKLDSLLAQSGELLVARRRVEFRPQDVVTLRDRIAVWRNEWREAEKPLRRFLQWLEKDETREATPMPRISRRATVVLEQTSDRLRRLDKDLERLASDMAGDGRLLRQTCTALEEEVYRARMLPFAEACRGLERTVRDIAQASGKDVELILVGEDVEVDRSVLEGLKDPLLHLVRNAVDHGLEDSAARRAAGKPPRGRITVSAALLGEQVEVVVADDGKGFDLERIRAKALQKQIPVPQNEHELARLVFMPGFTTAPIVTDVSGRGVGLDVVKSRIESLHGTVDVSFERGHGSQFTLTAPLTLTTIRCVLVVAGGETYAISNTNVQELVRFGDDAVHPVGDRNALLRGAAPIPLATLTGTLGYNGGEVRRVNDKLLAIVLAVQQQRVALLIDDVLTEQDVLVKNLGSRLKRVRHVSGATLLPTGRVALVLNAHQLVRSALQDTSLRDLRNVAAEDAPHTKKRLLVVDDSVTTRTLMASILETAGYATVTAADGELAWQQLLKEPFDLVVSDVDMPRLDGFGLTETIRKSAKFAELPVVLVTARQTDEDKARGIQVGANGYLVKSSFDQHHLLETIAQLL